MNEDFTVPLRYFTQSCWAQWQSYQALKSRSLLNLCIMHPITIPIKVISTKYPGNSPSYQAGKHVTLSVRGIVQLENEIWFLIIKNINRCCRQVLQKDMDISVVVRFPPGLPQGALFTRIICNSLFRLCALSDISAYTSLELWKRRRHESVLVVILLGGSWLSDDIISVP